MNVRVMNSFVLFCKLNDFALAILFFQSSYNALYVVCKLLVNGK